MDPLPYIPGMRPGNPGLLARFLPLIEEGTVSAWLASRLPAGSWLLDPFGTSPRLALEAARLGYRVLLTANNPIARFLVEMAACAPAATPARRTNEPAKKMACPNSCAIVATSRARPW